jgi:hypothetical protein
LWNYTQLAAIVTKITVAMYLVMMLPKAQLNPASPSAPPTTFRSQTYYYSNLKIAKMKKWTLILLVTCLLVLYWVSITQVAKHYWDEAAFHYRMGAMHYSYGFRDSGKMEGEKAEAYKQKGNRTLLCLPKFVRPNPIH